jgi:hypothetical protein
MSRTELAEKLNVSLASVNNWLSCTNIPEKRWLDIIELFEEPEQVERKRIIGSAFSDEELELIKKAAGDIPLEEFVRDTLLKRINRDIKSE